MTSAPTADEHRSWFSKLLPFASGGSRMLVLRVPGGDPNKPDDYFQIADLGDDGVTVMPNAAKDNGFFRFTWSESAAMETDIGRFWLGQINREQLDAKHPHAWVGLAIANAAELELMRIERAGEAPVQRTGDLEDAGCRLRDDVRQMLGASYAHVIPIFPIYPQPFDTTVQPVDLLIVRALTDDALNFISRRLNEETTVTWAVMALNEPECRACLRGEFEPSALLGSHKAGPEMATLFWELNRLVRD